MIRTTLSAVTAVFMAAVTGVVITATAPAPAGAAAGSAAACSGATGVTVIVDFNELDGGITAACDADGAGKSASEVFVDAGYPLTYVQQDPGFVCTISSKPADAPCARTPPPTAYWSLWWSNGESGRWVYATSGVNTLEVPDGGYLAFAWHQGSGNAAPPDANPTAHQATQATQPTQPTQDPTDDNGGTGGNGNGNDDNDGATTGSASTSAPTTATAAATTDSAAESASTGRGRTPRDGGTSSVTASDSSDSTVPGAAEITDGPPPSDLATDTSDDDGALPTWIGLGLAALVLGAAGLVALLRRRSE